MTLGVSAGDFKRLLPGAVAGPIAGALACPRAGAATGNAGAVVRNQTKIVFVPYLGRFHGDLNRKLDRAFSPVLG